MSKGKREPRPPKKGIHGPVPDWQFMGPPEHAAYGSLMVTMTIAALTKHKGKEGK